MGHPQFSVKWSTSGVCLAFGVDCVRKASPGVEERADQQCRPARNVRRPGGGRRTVADCVSGRAVPGASETFVYREVRALRERGWTVHAVTLNDPAEPGQAAFVDLERGLLRVYGTAKGATLAAAGAEAFLHPLRSLGTLLLAAADATFPGEKASLGDRVKGIAQAIAGIGLARRLRKHGVRHLHSHFAHAPASVGMYAAWQAAIPFSFTGHANDLFQRRALLRRKLSRAAFVACISEWHRTFYRALAPEGEAEPGKYPVIRCGVDISAWRPAPMKENGGPTSLAQPRC